MPRWTVIKAKLKQAASLAASAAKGFLKDDCFSKASSLTFYTLLSIVPILAVAFGIAKGFGFEEFLEREIKRTLIEQPEVAHKLITFAYSALAQVHGGIIATVGLVSLLWTSLQLLGSIELSLNEIWEVKSQRSFVRQFTDYLAILILCPIFIVLSGSITVFAASEINKLSNHSQLFQAIGPYILILLNLFPFILFWVLFSFIYIFMPNTTVKWKTAMIAGILAGSVYQLLSWIYIHFQIGVSSYGAIYGSFAALPLFLVWVNLSWVTILGGAELAFHMEVSSGLGEGNYQLAGKKLIGMAIVACCSQVYLKGKKPLSIHEIIHETGAPLRVARYIAAELYEAGILAMDQKEAYLPAKNPEDIKVKDIFDALDTTEIKYSLRSTPYIDYFEQSMVQFNDYVSHSEANITIKQLVARFESENQSSEEQSL